ncbi:MAG: DUF2851 family protein [Chloroflexi bacterium]|nr:DUF2851 family protein [Chloroflexota bacterium]
MARGRRAAPEDAAAIDERLVARLWRAQAFARDALRTLDGRAVQIVYPGRPRPGGGPDYQGALVVIDHVLARGDVELHLRAGDWARHGHDRDPAYNATLLHVVLWDDGAVPARRADGALVPTLALAPYLRADPTVLAATLPADAPPWPLSERGPCAPDTAQVAAQLDAAGLARFAARQARYAAELEERAVADLLLGGLVEAMGYGVNREPARALAARLPAYAPLRALVRRCAESPAQGWQALLLGLAGLLPAQRGQAPARPVERRWEALWPRLAAVVGAPALAAAAWRTAGLRPVSHPARRLEGLGVLLGERPLEALLGDAARALLVEPPRRAARTLAQSLVVPAPRAPAPAPALLGPDRAADIVVNVLLPLLAAWGESLAHAPLAAAARACYLAHPPLSDNERLRHMRRQVLGRDDRALLATACRQQGLLHIYAQTCAWRRCSVCLVRPPRDGAAPDP